MTQHELKEKVIEAVEANHIYIDAFLLIKPSDEMYIRIGKSVVEMLKNENRLLPLYFENSGNEVTEIQRMTPVLYLSVNQS